MRSLTGAVIDAPANLKAEASGTTVVLTWAAVEDRDGDLAGYRIHYGLARGSYTTMVDAGNNTTATLGALQEDETYFISVTAFDIWGNKSGYSPEAEVNLATGEIVMNEPVRDANDPAGEGAQTLPSMKGFTVNPTLVSGEGSFEILYGEGRIDGDVVIQVHSIRPNTFLTRK